MSDVQVNEAKEFFAPSPAGPSKGTIAVDMDDVLAQTNQTIVEMHNARYGMQPPLSLADFKHYLYWNNRGWGDAKQTAKMVVELCNAGLYGRSAPVPGAREGLQKLKDMGYRLIIITARGESSREVSEDWIAEHMPDLFDEIHFTGAFVHLAATHEEDEGHVARRAVLSHKKRTKAEICHETGAFVLIDDSAENVLHATLHSSPPVQCLLFGTYGWNASIPSPDVPIHPDDRALDDGGLTYLEKEAKGALGESEERWEEARKRGWVPDGVERVADWEGVVEWVKKREGKGEEGS
ncbi:HAD-like domain-containing protein [Dioszegia hungarica]|uniref:HAD-like domain-containing protein n=1 Tax=Dioszegia hungarica TaxID=4972 RepID=A0AA38LXH2_9TREE|nr:HAD-like domain-containing protein [Dioszegia hungarica]KAI9639630.1 HAD-like domain-containing protein [Dioszegia hungarica]